MRRSLATALSAAEFTVCAVGAVPFFWWAHLRSRKDPTRRLAGRCMRSFGKLTSSLTPLWHFSVEGEPPPDIATRAYVVVSNHESNADPFLLSWLPWDMRWIAKQELFELPLLGLLMRLGGDIPLRRGDRQSVATMLAECRSTLDGGLSIMMFPEGTRSRDGRLQPFKDGAFRLAIEAGVPILPIAIAGTRTCLPKGSLALGEARAVARVLEPIETRGLEPNEHDVAVLREQARDAIAVASASQRERLGERADDVAPEPTEAARNGRSPWKWLTAMA